MQPLQLTVATLVIMALTGTPWALAETTMLKPDQNGDYFRNDAPIQATEPRGKRQAGSLWRVVALSLNCRNESGIVRKFRQGELLQADLGRGGSDEVLVNANDRNGKPWMRARSAAGKDYNCYVRANQIHIRPYINSDIHPNTRSTNPKPTER
jgi:hypothetical protein